MVSMTFEKLSAHTGGDFGGASLPLAPAPRATPEGVYVELPHSREGFGSYRAYLFSVEPSKGTVRQELETLLGKEATDQLACDWRGRCDLDQPLEATQVALFLDSNNKPRNWDNDYADRYVETTQEEDFKATGYEFSGDHAATLLCARIAHKAQSGCKLSDAEQDLYRKLGQGVIRSCSGALGMHACGPLRAPEFFYVGPSAAWAFGSPRSPESK